MQEFFKHIKCKAHNATIFRSIYVYIEIIITMCLYLAVYKIVKKYFKGTIISHFTYNI